MVLAFCAVLPSFGAGSDRYASQSALSTGKWARFNVSEEGLQFISNSELRRLGFSDPQKVNVYGYGGREIDERLHSGHPDDLPLQPCVHTQSGILFYGTGSVGWKASAGKITPIDRVRNRYSDHSYYYISDKECDFSVLQKRAASPAAGGRIIDRGYVGLLHEQELAMAANTGALALGEDFRVEQSKSFSFRLPGNTGAKAYADVNFATRTTSGSSSLLITANGNLLPSTTADVIAGITDPDMFIRQRSTVKEISGSGEKIDLGVKWIPGGAVQTARLDYITMAYERYFRLDDGPLLFSHSGYYDDRIEISGADATVLVYDVTDSAHPIELEYELKDGKACFTPLATGLRFYIAFRPDQQGISLSRGESVGNQNLHGLSSPDMLIICPKEFRAAADRIASLHLQQDGIRSVILTPSEIYNEFSSGVPDVSAYRKLMKMWWDREPGKLKYCLLMGKPTVNQKGLGVRNFSDLPEKVLIRQSIEGDSQTTSYSTDDLIVMLEDCHDTRFNIANTKMDVAVGRIPVSTVEEADASVLKIENYVKRPILGSWRNRVLVIADDEDNGEHLRQAEIVYSALKASGHGASRRYDRLYLDTYVRKLSGTGVTYPEATAKLLQSIREGVAVINYTGHANPTSWSHESLLPWTEIKALTNRALPFIFAATCEFARWDDDGAQSGGEHMWHNPDGGIIGMMAPSRKAYVSRNGLLNASTARRFFAPGSAGLPRRIGDIYKDGKNGNITGDDNQLRYVLIGDPALRLPDPEFRVVVDSIADCELAKAEASGDLPVLKAADHVKISGRILNPSGELASDFNGVMEPLLFDAERVIETYGNGKDGKKMFFNDRPSLLYSGKVEVKDGRWESLILMPSNIDNNYSPALLNFYACGSDGREASGSTESLYVYGYTDNPLDDSEGPEISSFGLNTQSFVSGGVVNSSPMVLASLRDPSGIAVSSSALGHELKLTLDGKKVYADAASYFTPDLSDPCGGKLAYPLYDLAPGEHTLQLTAWDNANNVSTSEIAFKVAVADSPTLVELRPSCNPARVSVTFSIDHDRQADKVSAAISIYDLNGRLVRALPSQVNYDMGSTLSLDWDLCDQSGRRVERGIYIYRAILTDSKGNQVAASKKIAVTAP